MKFVRYNFSPNEGGGGGAKTIVWDPSSNIVGLNERITNLLLK